MRTILLSLFLFVNVAFSQIPTVGLHGEYKFTAGSLNDTFGTNNFTKTGTSSVADANRFGVAANALALNGDYLKRAALFSNDLSVSFWVKTTTNNATKRTIIDQTTRTSNTEDNTKVGWYTYLQNGKIGLAGNFSYLFTHSSIPYSGTSGYCNTISTATVSDGNWHHVVITMKKVYNYSTPALKMQYTYNIYVDNVLSGTNGLWYQSLTSSTGHQFNLMSTLTTVTVANDHLNNLTNRYTESIDDIRFYRDHILTATEVTDLFNDADGFLSADDFTDASDFTLYPNPTKSILNINTEEEINTAEIYSLEGKKILECNAKQIDVNSIPTGFYILKVTTASNKTGIKKFLKQ